jgi:hypothetical protein
MKSELFLEHNGIKIWHAYKYKRPLDFWYSTKPHLSTGDNVQPWDFDVRQLPEYLPDSNHAEIIRKAIENDHLPS